MHRTIAFTDWYEIKIDKIKHRIRLVLAGDKLYLVKKGTNTKVFCLESDSPINVDNKNKISISHARKLGIL